MPKGHALMLKRGVKLLKYGQATVQGGGEEIAAAATSGDEEESSEEEEVVPFPSSASASAFAPPALDSVGGMEQWLKERQLEEYLPTFVEQGYDTLEFLRGTEIEEFINLVAACGMIEEQGELLQREIELLKQGQLTSEQASGEGSTTEQPEEEQEEAEEEEGDTGIEGVQEWLRQRRLEKYLPAFLEQGYDSLALLRRATVEDIQTLAASSGMPNGHARMLERGMLLLKQGQVPA